METKQSTTKYGTGVLLSGLIFGLTFLAATARADDCRNRLLGNSYSCPFTFQVVTTTDGSDRVVDTVQLDADMQFSDFTGDSNPGKAFVGTFSVASQSRTAYCSCKSKGSSGNPKLGESPNEFVCVIAGGANAALTLEGRATGNGKKINQGELWFADPLFDPTPGNGQFRRGVFTCQRN